MNFRTVRLWLLLTSGAWIAGAATATIVPRQYLEDIQFLASPQLKGRATGSPELEKAAAFLRAKFRSFGLLPPDGKHFEQPFEVTVSSKPGRRSHLRFIVNGRARELKPFKDFIPLHFSSAARAAGGLAFVGYGITAPELHYDDYADIDVKGKIVIVLRHEPQEHDEHSVFGGRNTTRHAQFLSKASNAKMHGAAGVILVNDVPHHANEPDELVKFDAGESEDIGIPFVHIQAVQAEPLFAAVRKNLGQLVDEIDRDLKPESFAFPETFQVEEQADVERVRKTVHNVAAYLPGSTREYVILGAHYDHLGLGGQYSLAPAMTGRVHPGADDNASGTAGLIELARWFANQPKQRRGILFIAFAGEEEGLLGSAWWVAHPELPLDGAVAMINMDMIGRVRNQKLYIGGSGTGTGLRALLEKIAANYPLAADFSEGPESASSDHASFWMKHVPALSFFSGLHSDYHKPTDTWDKIDVPDAVRVLQLVAEVTDALRTQAERPVYQPHGVPHGNTSAAVPSSGSGYGPYFGSVPDFGGSTEGVRFADITAGSPAAVAGLQAGDVLVEFDEKPIANLYDFTYALRAKQPGDRVKVKVLRNGRPFEVTVVLTRRQ
jgi:aminopeptidase YwaD